MTRQAKVLVTTDTQIVASVIYTIAGGAKAPSYDFIKTKKNTGKHDVLAIKAIISY